MSGDRIHVRSRRNEKMVSPRNEKRLVLILPCGKLFLFKVAEFSFHDITCCSTNYIFALRAGVTNTE